MSAPDDAPTEDEQFAAYMKQHFRVDVPSEDEASIEEVPASEPVELDDDAKVDAYVRHYFAPTAS